MPVPKAIDGTAAPTGAGAPNILINIGGGDRYVFATWDNATESLTPWTAPTGAPKTGQVAHLEAAHASWWGASGGTDNNGRMMMVGWATPDFHGDAGKGITFLTRMTLLREVNYDHKLENLVANPLPELKGLRGASIASKKAVALSSTAHVVAGTDGGAAAAADIEMTFNGAKSGDTIDVCVLGSATNATNGLAMKLTVGSGGKAAATFGACGAKGDLQVEQADAANQFVIHEAADGIMVRILPDRSVADFFVQGGQVAGTTAWPQKDPRAATDSQVSVSSSGTGVTADIDVWSMGCGWTTPSFTDSPTM